MVELGTYRTRDDIAAAAQLACLLEASTPKPGNVSPAHSFHNMRYDDFLRSAVAIGPAIVGAVEQGVGATINFAIQATRRWTQANTNLGIVLLFAPLAAAAGVSQATDDVAVLRAELRTVLDALTVEDARHAYAAIRLAAPGGLGSARHDVRDEPAITLLDAMRSAAHRDSIAAEYASAYAITFERGLPTLQQTLARGATTEHAIIDTYLALLAAVPDTLIVRKCGLDTAQAVSHQAAQVLQAGSVWSAAGRAAIGALDAQLRDARNTLNPGTTADLVAATLFVALLHGWNV